MNVSNVLRPVFSKDEKEEILTELGKILDSGWIGQGPKVAEFEAEWAKRTGAKYAVATNSCTAALDIAVRCLNLANPVRVPALTFISTALAPYNAGYKVQFKDIDQQTLCGENVDIQVAYGGYVPEGNAVIWDMAHAGGEKHRGIISCWSFHAVKNLPTGDGGMLTTDYEPIYRKAKALAWCGIDKTTWERSDKVYAWEYSVDGPGMKANMNDITAVIGLAKLKNLDRDNAYRKQVAAWYGKYLPEWITRPVDRNVWHLYPVRVPERDALYTFLSSHGIGCGVHYKPLYHYAYFNQKPLPVTEQVFKEIISLPLHLMVTEEDVMRVCSLINQFYGNRI